jgi:hypothetical protein
MPMPFPSRLARDPRDRFDAHATALHVERDFAALDPQRVAQRDQLPPLVRGHEPREAGGGEDVALGDVAAGDRVQRRGLEQDKPLGDRFPRGDGLVPDVDHLRAAVVVEMGQFRCRCVGHAADSTAPTPRR